jgi:chaperonin GroES
MNFKKIKPLLGQVLVEPLESGNTTRRGIFIPDTAKEKPQRGKVIATDKYIRHLCDN